jgi:hypothetical protein
MVIIFVALLGVVLMAWEILSVRYVLRVQREGALPPRWRLLRGVALLLGTFLALATLWWWPTAFGYPYGSNDGVGRVVGIPFMAAYFDSQGYDYSGPLTLPAAIANAVVWFLAPWVVLATYGWRHRKLASGA